MGQSVTNAAALSTGTLDLNNPTISTLSTIGSGLMLTSTPVPSMMTTPKTFPSVTPVMLDMPSLIEPELPKEKPVEEPEERDPTLTDDNCVLDPETGKLIKIIEEPVPEPKPESSIKDSKKVEKKAESIKKPNIVSESKVEPKQSQSASISTVKVLPTMPILALPTSSKVEQNKAEDADFEALIAPKKVNLKQTKETAGSTKADSKIDKSKAQDENAQKVLLNEKITSVKVSSPMAKEMIEDTIEVAAKAVIENSDNAPEKSDKTSAKDMTEEKSEQETKEEVKEEAIKDEQEGILPRRRGRSTLASPKVTPLKKKKRQKS